MNQHEVNQMIETANLQRKNYITEIEKMLHDLLLEYDRLHDDHESEDYDNISVVKTLLQQPNWHTNHDTVWRIFLELQHSLSIKYMIAHADVHSSFSGIDLSQIQRSLDPDMNRNIKDTYTSKYLDSEAIHYDGDILICDPFILMDKTAQQTCKSMLTHDTLTKPQTYFAAKNDSNSVFGSVKITTGHICVVLMQDLWDITVNDILHRMDVWDYIYIKQFHGTIQCIITKEDTYHLRIIGTGNKSFVLEQLKK